jgi:hypothetical protein
MSDRVRRILDYYLETLCCLTRVLASVLENLQCLVLGINSEANFWWSNEQYKKARFDHQVGVIYVSTSLSKDLV